MKRVDSVRAAFTLIEVLVSISVIGLLAALLIPAVLSSREASRKVECLNRLKQIGGAIAAHEAALGRFPTGFLPSGRDKLGRQISLAPLSVHYQLLPFLEQTPLFHSINALPGGVDAPVATSPANETASGTTLTAFLCPSDGGTTRIGNNFRANVGSQPHEFDENPTHGGGGSFPGYRSLTGRDFTDGMSQTAAFAERVGGSGREARPDRRIDIWFSGLGNVLKNPTADQVYEGCGIVGSSRREAWCYAGESWMSGRYTDTLYNHVAPPNWQGMDCSLYMPTSDPGTIPGGAFTARGNHRSGVNMLLMDGSVRTISSDINLAIWRSLGTRAGHETVSMDAIKY